MSIASQDIHDGSYCFTCDFLADCQCLFCDAICEIAFDSCWELGEFNHCFGLAVGVTDDNSKSNLTYRQSYTRLTMMMLNIS